MRHEDVQLAKAAGPRQQGRPVRRPHRPRRHRRRVACWPRETFDDRRPGASGRACRSATRSPRSCSSSAAWRSSTQDLVAGIQDLGGAGLSCATTETGQRRHRRHARRPGPVPLRDATLAPARDPDERVAGADVRDRRAGERRRGSSPSAAKWDVLATVIGEVTEGDRLDDRLARRADRRRAAAHARPRGPGLRPADAPGPPTRTRCRPTTPAGCRGRRPARSCGALCSRWSRRPNLCRQDAGSPSSTTATCAATPCSPSPRTPAWSGSTRRPASASRWPPTATAATARLDPYAGAQLALAEAYRNVAATGARPLAVTDCLNFGSPEDPGGDVAVRRGHPRPRRRLPRRSACRSPAATSASTTRPATSRSTRRRSSACSACIDDVARRIADRASRAAGETRAAARRDPRGARRLGVGLGRARPPRRPAAAASTSPPSRRSARCWSRGSPRGPARRRARPVRRRPGAGAGRVRACAHGIGAAVALRRRPVRRAVQRVRRPRRRHHHATRRRWPTAPAGPASRSPAWARRAGTSSPSRACPTCRSPSCAPPGRATLPALFGTPRPRSAACRRDGPDQLMPAA